MSRFKQGGVPWNKGMTYRPGGRAAETQFKPGNRPQTWVPIGTERLDKDGMLWRKVADTRSKKRDWICVHVALWESVHGPRPKGRAIVFRDGNKAHIAIENLECIDRAELMRRNTVHRLPKELARAVQLLGALNRQINARTA